MVAKTTIVKDIIDYDSGDITCPTLYEYLDALERLMIIENQPAWSTHIIIFKNTLIGTLPPSANSSHCHGVFGTLSL